MSDTGGGHRAAARAIIEGLEARRPGAFHCRMVDPLADAAWPLRGVGPGYALVAEHLPGLYGRVWHLSDRRGAARCMHALLRPHLGPVLRRHYAEARPDLVVSVHPFLTRRALAALRSIGSAAPFVTVVTDLIDAHAMWFEPGVDRMLVPSPAVAERARQLGLPKARVHPVGQPIRPVFAAPPPPRPEARRALGLAPERPMVLITGGGDGLGPLLELTRAVAAALPASQQIAVVTGRNRAAAERLRREDWPLPVTVTGFVENMADWMFASDLVLAKAGPGTIMEALAAGLPILLHGYLPGQEEGNVRFLLEAGLGALAESPEGAARIAADWMAPEAVDRLADRQRRARAAAQPAAALDIADRLIEMLGEA